MGRRLSAMVLACSVLSAGSAYGTIDAAWNALAAQRDADIAPHGGGHALTLFNIGGVFTFDGDGMFVENDDGTAQLTGTLKHGNGSAYDLVVDFQSKTAAVDYFNEGKGPKLELYTPAYVPPFVGVGGGSVPVAKQGIVDPNTWRFYEMVSGMMMKVGMPSDQFTLHAKPTSLDPEGQVGVGANGKNANMGLAQWVYSEYSGGVFGSAYGFDPHGSGNKAGDFNLDLTPKETGVGDGSSNNAVPEPVTGGLGLIGLAALTTGGLRRRR